MAWKFSWLFIPCGLAYQKNGRDLLTPRNRHWYAFKERFQTRPMGRVFCAILDFKITSFVADSSRSYAKLLCLFLVVILFCRNRYAPSRRAMQAICVMGDYRR